MGIDPVFERLPREVRAGCREPGSPDFTVQEAVEAICRWTTGLLHAVVAHVPCVKFQSACFERYFWPGVEAYHRLAQQAQALGLLVIGDAKRGDIGVSAEHYAAGCLADSPLEGLGTLSGPDALTINSYFGKDGIDPFIAVARTQGKGLFALVRTSNPGGDAIQSLALADGRAVSEAVATLVADIGNGEGGVGASGYSLLGAVVGATKGAEAARLRELMPRQIFLVPGFGAQGGSADDVRACFNPDGEGAIITASRSVIYAHEADTAGSWQTSVERAAIDMKNQISRILGR